MYDSDVIAYLFPVEGQGRDGATEAIDMSLNRSRRRDSLLELAPETHSHFVREATEQPEEEDDHERRPCLVLRFSNPPKTRRGLVAGRSPHADLVLPKLPGVSWYHFALTFDEEKCLIVKDLGSTVGTRVIYDGEEGQRGHGVDWSARGPGLVEGKAPVIKVVGKLQFKLVVPDHDTTSQTYLDNVAQFVQGTAAAEDLFSDLNIISRTQTELPTSGEAHTPSTQIPGPILWKKELGRGSFAVVSYAWDVTSRAEYALKEPLPGKRGDWKREAEIMKGISHVSTTHHAGAFMTVLTGFSTQDHIVALKHASFDAGPQLYFEYVSGGSLEAYSSTTTIQRRQIAIQLLNGLTYLHGQKPSVVHRDIKPENVLVQHWSPDRVHVKLADFGLSKQSDHLETFCGTELYAAPEIFCTQLVQHKDALKYDPLVDTWSLSVLLAKLECHGLPKYFKHYTTSGTTWGKAMVKFVESYLTRHGANDLLSFLLEDVLVVDPKKRQPAGDCYDKALRLFGGDTSALTLEQPFYTETSDDTRPSPDDGEDSGEESDPATPRALPADFASPPQDSGGSEATTIRQCPREGEDSRQSLELSDWRVPVPDSVSLIAGLGENGSGFIDSLLGIKPSDMTEFERSNVPPPDVLRHMSVVDGELWNAEATTGARGSAAGLEKGEDGQCVADADSVGSGLRATINHYLANAEREEDSPNAIAVEPQPQRKRPRPGGDQDSRTASFPSRFANQDTEDGVSKRSKVWIAENQA